MSDKMMNSGNNNYEIHSLYHYSLRKFVNEINLRVKNSDRMKQIRMLPPRISSDIYKQVSLILCIH